MLLLPVRVGTPRDFWVAWQCPRQGKGAGSDAGIRPVLSHRQTWRALLMGGLAWLLGSKPLSFWTLNTLCPLVQGSNPGCFCVQARVGLGPPLAHQRVVWVSPPQLLGLSVWL